jgi:hypothetical protein
MTAIVGSNGCTVAQLERFKNVIYLKQFFKKKVRRLYDERL